MKSFAEFMVYREDMYTDEDIINFMPGDVEHNLTQLNDDNLLFAIVAQVKKDLEAAYQSYVARKAPSPNVDAIWRKYINVKSVGDLQKIASTQELTPQKAVARAMGRPAVDERTVKNSIYNLLIQKLAKLGNQLIPSDLSSLLKINPTLKRDFESRFVAQDIFSTTKKGVQTDVFMPFYKDGQGNIRVAPNFAFQRYPEWPHFLNNMLETMPLQVLQKHFKT
jgi:hypothetical protein